MTYFLRDGVRKFSLILLLIVVQFCTTVPETDFYSVEGITSIGSEDLASYQGWEFVEQQSVVSLVFVSDSIGNTEPISFPFYVRESGVYSLWILGNSDRFGSGSDHISISLLDE